MLLVILWIVKRLLTPRTTFPPLLWIRQAYRRMPRARRLSAQMHLILSVISILLLGLLFGRPRVGYSYTAQREVIHALEEAGIRDQVRVMVGGAPVTQRWAESIGADGYAEDVVGAVELAKRLTG